MCPVHNIVRKLSPGALNMIVLEINAMVGSRARDFNVNKAVGAPARLCVPALATKRIICHTFAQYTPPCCVPLKQMVCEYDYFYRYVIYYVVVFFF